MTPYPRALALFPSVRQSALATFADCGLSAGFGLRLSINHPSDRQKVPHTSGWTTHRATAGRVAHATVARALRHMLQHHEESIDPDTMEAFLRDELAQRDVPLRETAAVPPHEFRFLQRTLRKFARDNAFTIADVVGIERRLTATITYPDGNGGEVERMITGQLDALLISEGGLGRHATVPDWKHTWKLPAQQHDDAADEDDGEDDKLSPEGYFQQMFYALLVFLTFPQIQSVTLREFYLPRSEPREATIWRHEMPWLLDYFGSLVERFDRSVEAAYTPAKGRRRRAKPLTTPEQWGEPTAGAHCRYCPLAVECPLDADIKGPQTVEHAQKVLGEALKARRVVKQHMEWVAQFTDRYGPLRVRDGKRVRLFGHVVRKRTERPTRAQVEQAIMRGQDVRELYRSKTHTALTEYSPEGNPAELMDDDDVVALFEQAAEAAKRRRARAA